MEKAIAGIIAACGMCAIGAVIYYVIRKKITPKPSSSQAPLHEPMMDDVASDNSETEKIMPSDQETTPKGEFPIVQQPVTEDEPQTEQRQLLEQLRSQRAEIALAIYRQDCATLFHGLCDGIQSFLAHASDPTVKNDAVFCNRLVVSAQNTSMRSRIALRKEPQELEPISPEIEGADVADIREMIRLEKKRCPDPVIKIQWDELMASLLPTMESLLQAAEDMRADDCRRLLSDIQNILRMHNILFLWYDDEVVRNNVELASNYINDSLQAVPAFFYYTDGTYMHIGSPGSMGQNFKKEVTDK